MCGLVGYWMKNNNLEPQNNELMNAVSRLNKRGPDFQNTTISKNVGLGHARLSIIDVSPEANQPFTDKSENYTIIFNGEIYNFEEIKKQLSSEGIEFRTHSDTEVLLELYKKHKHETPKLLNGFFAFAIYDKINDSIFIARDRIGIKPLYLYQDANKYIFASEIKAIREFNIDKTLNHQSIYNYFRLNYIPEKDTIFKNVSKVNPGTWLEISKSGIKQNSYYKISEIPSYLGTYEDAKLELNQLLTKSIERRLVSDVPLGTFLSGGIDSSVIVSLTAQLNKNIETFSIGFPSEPYFDETNYAKLVAKKWDIKHNIIDVTSKDLLNILPNVLEYLDQPFADSSALPVYILSEKTKQNVTVALSGDGADELFGGYKKHLAHTRALNNCLSNQILKYSSSILKHLPQSRNNPLANKIRQAQRFSEGLKLNGTDRYLFWASISSHNEVSKLLKHNYTNNNFNELVDIPKKHNLHNLLHTDCTMLLTSDMLTKVDQMSMANSLEVRVPFLDHEVVNFAMSLPDNFKINKNIQKRILQDTFRDILPKELYNRPKKGFEVPLLKWLRTDLYQIIFNDLLNEKTINQQNIFNFNQIEKLRNKLMSNNPGDSPAKIWALVVFQYWWKNLIQ